MDKEPLKLGHMARQDVVISSDAEETKWVI